MTVERVYPSGEHIFRFGDPAGSLYVVLEGEVTLFRDRPGQPIQLQARLGRGQVFGETGLFDESERSASAAAGSPARILELPRAPLLAFLDEHPEVALRLQMAAARRHSQNVSDALELGQRNEVRIRLGQQAQLDLDEGGPPRRVTVENLSIGGVCLRDVPMAWNRHWTVRFTLRIDELLLPVIGRVAWRRSDTVGIAFTRTDEDHDHQVQAMMRRLLGGVAR
jgi:CRP-like cAMP-binding protein